MAKPVRQAVTIEYQREAKNLLENNKFELILINSQQTGSSY